MTATCYLSRHNPRSLSLRRPRTSGPCAIQDTGCAMALSTFAHRSSANFIAFTASKEEKDLIPLVAGLLPDKTRATYTKFFEVVRAALISACGDVGELRFGHFDFEMVAISTFEVTFPGAESKGCLFHFAHCVIRKMA